MLSRNSEDAWIHFVIIALCSIYLLYFCTQVTQIVAHLSDNERHVTALFQELRFSLVYAKKWIRRQTFAFVCAKLISSNAISGDRFSQEMLPNLLKLSTDKVPNVRLVVARTLSKNVIPMGCKYLFFDIFAI